MQEFFCSIHSDRKAAVYCGQCSSNQVVCLRCLSESGKHCDQLPESDDTGREIVLDKYAQLLLRMQEDQRLAEENYKQTATFHSQLRKSIQQSTDRLHKVIQNAGNDLQEARVTINTAILQTAHTARSNTAYSVDSTTLSFAADRTTAWLRRTTNYVSSANLAALIDGVVKLDEMRSNLATEIAYVKFKITSDLPSTSAVGDELSALSGRTQRLLNEAKSFFDKRVLPDESTQSESELQLTEAYPLG